MAEPLKMEEKGAPPIITQDLGVRREHLRDFTVAVKQERLRHLVACCAEVVERDPGDAPQHLESFACFWFMVSIR